MLYSWTPEHIFEWEGREQELGCKFVWGYATMAVGEREQGVRGEGRSPEKLYGATRCNSVRKDQLKYSYVSCLGRKRQVTSVNCS